MALRVGISGTGHRGAKLAAALRGDDRVRLIAVQDPRHEARRRFAADHELEDHYSEFEELLDRVDLVVVCSPVQHHAPQARQALEHGVHVLSEVPAAVNEAQAADLVAAARSSDARYGLAENYCYKVPNLVVRELVRRGELGDLYYGEHDYLDDIKSLVRTKVGEPHWGNKWWLGRDGNTYPTHSLGPLLQWFDDRVVAVSCTGSGRRTEPEHEMQDTTVMLARLSRGGLLRIRFSWLSNRPQLVDHYGIQGTLGAYDAGDPLRGVQPALFLISGSPANAWAPLERFRDRLPPAQRALAARCTYPTIDPLMSLFGPADASLLRDFVDAVLHERPFDLDIDAALDLTLPGFAAERSIAQHGAWIHVPNPRLSYG